MDYQRFSSSGILRAGDKFLPLRRRRAPRGVALRTKNARDVAPTLDIVLARDSAGLAVGRRREPLSLLLSSTNRCYTGGCFIARFAAWPPRVTRLTEILIESETTHTHIHKNIYIYITHRFIARNPTWSSSTVLVAPFQLFPSSLRSPISLFFDGL